jgi:phosphonate transport system substrate-binding protein
MFSPMTRRQAAARLFLLPLAASARAEDTGRPVRFAVSEEVLGEVNRNDAKASLQVWTNTVTKSRHFRIDTSVELIQPSQRLAEGIRNGQIDAFSISTAEYPEVAPFVAPDAIIVDNEEAGQYVLLARKEGPFRSVPDLRGRTLLVYQNTHMCLFQPWLRVYCAAQGLPPPDRFFGRLVPVPKLTNTILPVFFGKADACAVTRRGLNAVAELNPQIGSQIAILASAPRMTVGGFAFHRSFVGPRRDQVQAAVMAIDTTPAGRQVMTLFRLARQRLTSVACLDTALDVLRQDARLGARKGVQP